VRKDLTPARSRKWAQAQARRQRLQAEGRCIVCGQPRRPGNKNYCQAHRDYHLQYQRTHLDRAAAYARVHAKHLANRKAHPKICQWCGRLIDPTRWPHRWKYHPACANAHARAVAVHPANPASHRRAVRAWQARKQAAGCCTCCGKLRGRNGTTIHCRACADKHTARAQRRSATKRKQSTRPIRGRRH